MCTPAFSSCGIRGLLSSWRCSASHCPWFLTLQSTGSRAGGLQRLWHTGSALVVHGLSHSATCGIFPDQGSNPCPLHWQVDSLPLSHQGSPRGIDLNELFLLSCVVSIFLPNSAFICKDYFVSYYCSYTSFLLICVLLVCVFSLFYLLLNNEFYI